MTCSPWEYYSFSPWCSCCVVVEGNDDEDEDDYEDGREIK